LLKNAWNKRFCRDSVKLRAFLSIGGVNLALCQLADSGFRAGCDLDAALDSSLLLICYNFPMNSPSAPELPATTAAHDALAHVADRVGATASLLCAIHCAALPFVIAVLPALGLSFLADHKFERIFIACASMLALAALIRGYYRHRVPSALVLALPGLALLWVGVWVFDAENSLTVHAIMVTVGGCCVALAHVINLRLTHLFGQCCEPGEQPGPTP
jgi:hypothetical protein